MSEHLEISGSVLSIDICVCTFRRPFLEQTLRSLAALEISGGWKVEVIVADNDVRPSARELVERLAAELPFEVRYIHCPAANISLARNACLDAATGRYLAFIDDDSTASPQWLEKLVETAAANGSEAVLGPVNAVYRPSAPAWMRHGDIHSTRPVLVNGEILTGYSGNALLDRASPHVRGRHFNLALGLSGGEDTEYFSLLHKAGGRIAYAPDAIVHEPVRDERARFSWLAKRRFRSGQTHGRLLLTQHAALPQIGLAAAKAVFCFVAAGLLAVVPHRRNRQALRGVMHAGVVSGLSGMRELHLYGDKPAKGQAHAA
jgi:succinoglycan biosynthesis protein ExoM